MSGIAGIALALAAARPPAPDLEAAWLRDGVVETRGASAAQATLAGRSPLGSVWKLFVFAYAVEAGVETPAYRCGVPRRAGDEYCCEPGASVERDAALARSCGAFFDPHRLGIEPAAWRAFWTARTDPAGAWVAELSRLTPQTEVAVPQLLHALAAVPAPGRAAASRALLPVLVEGYGRGALGRLGGMLRVKTFTWRHPRRPGASLGGGAGWLVDGTPVWFAASGSSRNVLREAALRLAAWLPPPVAAAAMDEPCVVVDYFERYPLRSVDALPSRAPAAEGPLHGRYRLGFENGSTLVFTAAGEMRLERSGARPHLRGRMGLGSYVARVLDREADPRLTEAARALAVVARSWLVQNAAFEAGCYRVADSTRAQRVSPNPASLAARRAAAFTDGLVLSGQPVSYRLDGGTPGTLAWTAAAQQARDGRGFDAILAAAFPRASLAAATGEQECRRLPEIEAWLARTAPRWRRALAGQPGFEPPSESLSVCALGYGNPYSDAARLRVYVRGLAGREDRITLAHEYVHLAFRFHPRGGDEAFVEGLARSLSEE